MTNALVITLLSTAGSALAKPQWPELSGPPPGAQPSGSGDAALVIAIEDYAYAPDIPGALSNGRDWASWLRGSRGVGLVKPLFDSQAYREQILLAARDAAARTQPGGRLWIVFIGHGAPAQTGTDGVLVGADAQPTALGLESRSITRQELLDAVSGGRQGETVVILDACFSGRTEAGELAPGLQPLKPVSARIAKGRVSILTAAGANEYTGALPGSARPAFSYLALGGLRGWADLDGDGQVTATELTRFTGDALFQTLTDRRQSPSLDGPDLVLGHGREPAPDLLALAMSESGTRTAEGPLAMVQESKRAIKKKATSQELPSPVEPQPDPTPLTPLTPSVSVPGVYPAVTVSPGKTTIGSPSLEAGRYKDEQQQGVEIRSALIVGKTEVTTALWDSLADAPELAGRGVRCEPKSRSPAEPDPAHPKTCVSWHQALAFANALSARVGLPACYDLSGETPTWPEGPSCQGWRLPTEAEWEYLARAGAADRFAGAEQAQLVAWFSSNSAGRAQPVAGLAPNGIGVYDLSGNAWEWVWESPGSYSERGNVDPVGEALGPVRVVRGGSWASPERDVRVAARGRALAAQASDDIGFRLVRSVIDPSAP